MDRRTLLAIVAALGVLLGFTWLQSVLYPAPPRPQATGESAQQHASEPGDTPQPATATAALAAEVAAPVAASPTAAPAPEANTVTAAPISAEARTFEVRLGELALTFDTVGARVVRLVPDGYKDFDARSPLDLLRVWKDGTEEALALRIDDGALDLARVPWRVVEQGADAIVFEQRSGDGLLVRKRFAPDPRSRYALAVTVSLRNESSASRRLGYELTIAGAIRPEEPSKREMGYDYGLVGQRPEDEVDLEKESATSLPLWGDEKPRRYAGAVVFAGIESKYFAICLAPEEQQGSRSALLFSKEGPLDGARGDFEGRLPGALWRAVDVDVPPGASVQHRYVFYAGPKRDEDLAPFTAFGMDKVADVSSMVPLASTLSAVFLELLGAFVAVVRSYGIAIILLTLLVRALLHPLSRASQRSTYKMQKLAPVVNEIRERYKGKTSREQQQKMNMEIMELYKRNGASPLAGCLPMLLQFPVIIGLYNALAYDIELRQTQFLYIRDLSKPDRLMDLGMNLPWPLEGYLNLLPILMVVLMIVQQRLAPKPADPQQQQQMKIMQYVMVLFGVMFYTVPSGLGLYFLTSSTVGALETRWIRKQLEKEELVTSAAPPPAPRATRQPKKSRRVKGGRPGEKREKRKKFV